MALISTDNAYAQNHKGENIKTMQQQRISKFAESSDESENEDVKNEMKNLNNSENLSISSPCDLVGLSSIDTSNKSYVKESHEDSEGDDELIVGLIQKKTKKRVLQLAESSDDSDDEDISLHVSNQFSNLKAKEVEKHFALPLDAESDMNAAIGRKKMKKRVVKLSESSDESDNDSGVTCQIQHDSAGEEIDEAGTSKMNVSVGDSRGLEQSNDSDSDSSDSDDDSSSSSSDDDAAPIRIFRNKDAAAMNSRGYDSGQYTSDDEAHDDVPSSPHIPFRPRRQSKPHSSLDIKSETQRLIRESSVNLPYYVPEAKKLSDFLKRPVGLQDKRMVEDQIEELANEPTQKEDPIEDEEDAAEPRESFDLRPPNDKIETDEGGVATGSRKKAQLLALRGVHIPELNSPKLPVSPKSGKGFVDLDDEESQPIKEDVSNFMQRILKQTKVGKISMARKKVQFNIIRKEERADGSGVELVPDVVTSVDTSTQDADEKSFPTYKRLRANLTAKMKQRRERERLKREEIYKLDNEEVGKEEDDEDEEELDDDWSDAESEQSVEEKDEVVDQFKNHVIEDDDEEDDDVMSLDTTQPVPSEVSLSNTGSVSRASQQTKSDILFPHLSREGSMLLFDDCVKKSSRSHEDLSGTNGFEAFDASVIPLHQPEISNISEISKPPKTNFDDDSYFCPERSLTPSTNASLSRIEYQSQFLDSDGFLKEPKASKSLSSLLPPGGEDDNANDCNMSQLLELCSGKFQESDASPHVPDVEASGDVNGNVIDESFGFQVEPADTFKEAKLWKTFSDAEDSDAEEPDEGITIIRRKKDVLQPAAENFLEEEAELSGDDVGSDEEEPEGEDYYEEEENDEVLPQEDVMQQQVNKVHLKQLLDEDQRDIDLLQEAFVEEAVELKRNRKFRWKHIDDNLTQDLFHSDDEKENCEEDKETEQLENEDTQWRMLRLEREEFLDSKTSDGTTALAEVDDDSQLLKMGRSAIHRSRSRILSEINEDVRDSKPLALSRSSSLTAPKLPSKNSFLCRKPEILSKFASFKESKVIKGAVNSDRMVFKTVSPSKNKIRKPKRPSTEKMIVTKRLKMDEDSNSVFDLFET